MKLFCLSLMLFLSSISYSFSITDPKHDLVEIRKQMLHAINNSKTADSLYNKLQAIPAKPPLVIAYIGALQALKARDSWNPYKKIKYLNLSHKTVDRAVSESQNDLEIRFIRFSIQFHLPGFLGLSKDMPGDKNEIIKQFRQKHYGYADNDYLQSIVKFMIDSKQCTPQEVAFLHEQSAALK